MHELATQHRSSIRRYSLRRAPLRRWLAARWPELHRGTAAACLVLGLGVLGAVSLPQVAGAADDEPHSSAESVQHLVFISVDGLRPEFYLDPTWPAPVMQEMARQGAHARAVRGVFPTVTYPSHTTLVTGVRPARHGIYYNAPFEPGGQTGRWYWDASEIKVPTLWQAVRKSGRESASVGWPVTLGAAIDRNIPEVWSLDRDADPLDAARAGTRPVGLWQEIEREATGRLSGENFTIDHFTRDDKAGAAAAYLLEQYRPALLLVHLIETDHFQHEDGRESFHVRKSVAVADRAIAQIQEAAERAGIAERTVFLITGDHGHVDIHTRFAPNVWLEQAGLLWEPGGTTGARFHTTGASAFLHLAQPGDMATVNKVRDLLEALPMGERGLFHIVERGQLDTLGSAPEAALALSPVPGVHLSSSSRGDALRPASGATHGYLPDFHEIHTGLIVAGAGVRSGARAGMLRLEDVAPLAAALLGVDLPDTDGTVPLGFLASPQR